MKKPSEKPQFARNINYLRNRLRLTCKQISQKAGIPKGTWCSYEEGRAFPRNCRITTICEVLNFYDVLALINEDLSRSVASSSLNNKRFLQEIRRLTEQIQLEIDKQNI